MGPSNMTARDWATYGEFIRRQGNWNNQQILDPALLRDCFKGSKANPAYGFLEYRIKKLTSLLEPVVILVMGSIVGFVAIALVSAMYGIYHQVQV